VVALHITGSNNPLGIDVKSEQDTVPFHPYYTMKDSVGMCVYFLVFAAIIFLRPYLFSEVDNNIPANPLQTPNEIVPEWYLLPYYAILRSVPDKLLGVCCMFGSILVLFIMPWLDTSKVRSARFRPIFRWMMFALVLDMFLLGHVGANKPEGLFILEGRLGTLLYFLFYAALPFVGWFEKPLPLPESISNPVLPPRSGGSGGGGPLPAGAVAKPMEKS
jgi:ubiquinol-cytochrome c reductase cytochrome b/c1 subunit